MVLSKGMLVWAHEPPIRGRGWPGIEVLGVVYAIIEDGVWVEWPGGHLCLHRPLGLTSPDRPTG